MPIITDSLKATTATNLIYDLEVGSGRYYIGIGRSQEWPDSDFPPELVNTISTERDFRYNLQGVKETIDGINVVPRVNWSAGTIYGEYDDAAIAYSTPPFYVMNAQLQVFVCLRRGRTNLGVPVPSVVQPSGVGTNMLKTGDGYIWKYLYTLTASQSQKFLSANFIPVDTDSDIATMAIGGQITSVVVTGGGTGYTTAPSVIITGTGTGATAQAVVAGGAVVRVDIDSTGSGQPVGSNYDCAAISFSGGNAQARAIVGPRGGFGLNPAVDLRSTAMMFNVRLTDDEGGLIVNQDFRQVGLFTNIKKTGTDSDVVGAASALNKLLFSPGASGFFQDNIIVGSTSTAKAQIDYVDSSVGVLIHQTPTTGFRKFIVGESLTQQTPTGVTMSGLAVLSGIDSAEVNQWSGDLIYIDNRARINRAPGETQDIKIVIQL